MGCLTKILKAKSLNMIHYTFRRNQLNSPHIPLAVHPLWVLLKITPLLSPGSVNRKQTKWLLPSHTLAQPINNVASGAWKGGVYLIGC